MYKKISLLLLTCAFFTPALSAQQSGVDNLSDLRLDYIEPVNLKQAPSIPKSVPVGIDELERELMQSLANIYRQHVLSLDAQVNGDLVSAEKYIIDGLTAFQGIMEEYP